MHHLKRKRERQIKLTKWEPAVKHRNKFRSRVSDRSPAKDQLISKTREHLPRGTTLSKRHKRRLYRVLNRRLQLMRQQNRPNKSKRMCKQPSTLFKLARTKAIRSSKRRKVRTKPQRRHSLRVATHTSNVT